MKMYDVTIVFGYLIQDNGNLPEEQILRLRKGMNIIRKKQARYMVMAGGFPERFNNTKKSLAKHMKEFAIMNGIPDKKIIIENRSTNTIEDIMFSKKIVDRHRWKSIIFLSSKNHIPRIRFICKNVFSKKYKLKFVSVKMSKDEKYTTLEKERKKCQNVKSGLRIIIHNESKQRTYLEFC